MDIADLRTFLKVAETGSFSKAAEQLHVTQPAISKRLASLEQQLNTSLLERLPRNARLTPAGQLFKVRAEHILREIDNTKAEIQNLTQEVTGTLSIATSHHIGLHRLPKQIRKFLRTFPDVELDLHFLASEEAEKALFAADVELALLTLPAVTRDRLEYCCIWQDPLHFVVGPEHPLARKIAAGPMLPDGLLRELTKFRAILPGSESMTYQLISALFTESKLALKSNMPTNYLETIKMMVSVGLGWGVLPATMIDKSLVRLPIDAGIRRDLGVVVDKRRQLSKAADAFLAQLQGGSKYP